MIDAAACVNVLAILPGDGVHDGMLDDTLDARLDAAESFVNAMAITQNVLLLVTAILFIAWVRQLVSLTRALGGRGLAWRPKEATWAFILPVVSFFRPYQVLRDVQQELAPEDVLPAELRLDRDAQADYRSAAFVVPPPSPPLSDTFLAAWWGSFVAGNVLSRVVTAMASGTPSLSSTVLTYRLDLVLDVVEVAGAVLAVRVVRGLSTRLAERFRRIRHSTPESLVAQGVSIG